MAGQALVPVVVSAREGLLDREAYDSVGGGSPVDEPAAGPVDESRTVQAAA
ncbi:MULTISPECIES: hypothetical protein [unclassified Streptomyces]|uniref:hypothetical protein n=1 Tax=Streptomyces sp. NPDC052610 TaxID=3154952 RepID=UPI000A5EDE49